jgi:MFS transporter, PAT family, beta-lactamase induction signal transducer AmpG
VEVESPAVRAGATRAIATRGRPCGRPADMPKARVPHPVIWTILYLPFGALSGFVGVPMTFLASKHGISIGDAQLLTAASLISQWLKWTWAPAIDVTLTPKRWYLIGTVASAFGVFGMTTIPLSAANLPLLLGVIVVASLLNSIVGMAIEAIMAAATPPEEQGRTSAWFQAGNLGGAGLGGGIGMTLFGVLPAPWMVGAVMGGLFLCCCAALLAVPDVKSHGGTIVAALRGLGRDVAAVGRTKGGVLAAVICFLPIGTGAAQGLLAQAQIAAMWGAGEAQVTWIQGYSSAAVTAAGCFVGGWLCTRMHPRTAYAAIGVLLSLVAIAMALFPATVTMYVVWNVIYAFVVGFAYAAFTAVVLSAIGTKGGATKYTLYASLSNFPIWWVGILLGQVGEGSGARAMLLTEAALGVLAVLVFLVAARLVSRTRLSDVLVET